MEDIEKIKDEEKETQFVEGDTRTPADSETQPNLETQVDAAQVDTQVEEEGGATEPSQEGSVEGDVEVDAAQAPQDAPVETAPPVEEPKEKMFTQSQVNEIVSNRIKEIKEKMKKDMLDHYGVSTEGEMDEIFGKGQIYAELYDENESGKVSLREARSENALLKSGIAPERWDDVKAILGTKGQEISEENIALELPTHPEWKGGTKGVLDESTMQNMAMGMGDSQGSEKPVVVTKIGADPSPKKEDTELDQARAIYGLSGLKGIK